MIEKLDYLQNNLGQNNVTTQVLGSRFRVQLVGLTAEFCTPVLDVITEGLAANERPRW